MGDTGLKLCQKTDWHIGRDPVDQPSKCWQVEGNEKQQETSSTARVERWEMKLQTSTILLWRSRNLIKASN